VAPSGLTLTKINNALAASHAGTAKVNGKCDPKIHKPIVTKIVMGDYVGNKMCKISAQSDTGFCLPHMCEVSHDSDCYFLGGGGVLTTLYCQYACTDFVA